MKQLLFISVFLSAFFSVNAQSYPYKIIADSIIFYSNSAAGSNLQIKNNTRSVKGFLYNYGDGRTIFKQACIKLNDTTYVIGADTLKLSSGAVSYTGSNGITVSGSTIKFGGDLSQASTTLNFQDNDLFYTNVKTYQVSMNGTGKLVLNEDSIRLQSTQITLSSFNGSANPANVIIENADVSSDTSAVKPIAINSSGKIFKYPYWKIGTPGTVYSIATGYGLSGGTITTNGTLLIDSATLSAKYLRRADSTAGGFYPYTTNPKGYLTTAVSSFSFTNTTGITGSVSNASTTPALSLSIDSNAIPDFYQKVRAAQSSGGGAVDSTFFFQLTGNAISSSGNRFLGTTNNTSLRIRTNNTEALTIDSTQNIGIGVTTPSSRLHVVNNSLTGNNAVIISSNNTTAAHWQTGLLDSISGANSTSGQTTYAARFRNDHSGTSSLNIGVSAVSSNGASNNIGILVGGTLRITSSDVNYTTAQGTAASLDINPGNEKVINNSQTGGFGIKFQNAGADALSISSANATFAGGVVVNTGGSTSSGGAPIAPATSSILDVRSTTKGFLPPRMTQSQRNAISSPAAGLTIYCTDCTATDASTGVTQTYNGSTWKNYW